ncbi:MAG: transporter [Elusimicrobia bacterium]|nr:transporter [Elusimicrobiota bacterium]
MYIPFTLKRYYANASFSATVPYLSQSSTGHTVWVGGSPARNARPGGAAVTSGESGLGDIMLRAAYTLKREGPKSFDLALTGKLKLPTADEHKGLGTGEMDEGVGLEFAKEVTPRWSLLADGYYTIIGDPRGLDYNNQVALDVGFYRPLGNDLSLTVLYETQSAIVDGNADPRSLGGTLSYSPPAGLQLFCGLTLGMSDGSPDTGVSAGFSHKF